MSISNRPHSLVTTHTRLSTAQPAPKIADPAIDVLAQRTALQLQQTAAWAHAKHLMAVEEVRRNWKPPLGG